MFRRSVILSAVVLGLLPWLAGSRPAGADTLKLRGGRSLVVDTVRVGDRVVSVTLRRDGGTATMDLPFERLDPLGLLRVLDRHAAADDAAARLRSARLALEFGLRAEAAVRFHQAAQLDPALAEACDAGLAALRAVEAAEALVTLETHLRSPDGAPAALTLATALLDGPYRESLSGKQVLRIRTLARLARGVIERNQKRALAVQPATPPNPAVPAPASLPGPALPLGDLGARILAERTKARHAREAAARPQLDSQRVRRLLEVAARALLAGRRLLREVPGDAEATADLSAEFRRLLVATYLDLADLLRQDARFEGARAYVRAALILDPGNEAGWAQRELIEADVRRDPFDPYGHDGYGPVEFYSWYPGYGYGSYYPSRWRSYGTYYRRTGVVFRFGHPGHRHAPRGPRRALGTRRGP